MEQIRKCFKKGGSDTSTGLTRNVSFSRIDSVPKGNASTNTPRRKSNRCPNRSTSRYRNANDSDSFTFIPKQGSASSQSSISSGRSAKAKPATKKCSSCSGSRNKKAKRPANASQKAVRLPAASSTYRDSIKQPRDFDTSSLTNLYIEAPEDSIGDSCGKSGLWPPEDNSTFSRYYRGSSSTKQPKQKTIRRRNSNVTLEDIQGPMRISSSSMNQLTNKSLKRTPSDSRKSDGKGKAKICWALAQINLYKGGIREFEIMEVSPTPPGQYLIVNKNTLMLLESGAFPKGKG